ncbi:MAG: tRNA 2-thiouridine synthesizing protein D [Halioglobus sp.]|jgi:tRNA 2-thiouridine synthesizing protein D
MDEGVHAGSNNHVMPQDENNPVDLWAEMSDQHSVDLVLCVSSAIKRGLLDSSEAQRYGKGSSTIHPAFVISGLGQLVDATAVSDRLVTFGG